MEPVHVLTRTAEPPDAVLRYAGHRDAVIDLHLPPDETGRGRSRPLVVLLHGGFWRVAYDRVHLRPLADALARSGLVVAVPEYRRVGGTGDLAGGWPTTFQDVEAAVTALPGLLAGLDIAASRTTVMGHSAGGQLALWLANQFHATDRVVGLAPVGDLRAAARDLVGDGAVPALLGGSPEQVPETYDAADPATRFSDAPGCEVLVLHGTLDQEVPVGNSRGLAARHPGLVVLCELVDVGHYEPIDPLSSVFPLVRAAAAGEPVGRD